MLKACIVLTAVTRERICSSQKVSSLQTWLEKARYSRLGSFSGITFTVMGFGLPVLTTNTGDQMNGSKDILNTTHYRGISEDRFLDSNVLLRAE